MLVVKTLKRIHCKAEKSKGMNYETHRIISGCPCKARLGNLPLTQGPSQLAFYKPERLSSTLGNRHAIEEQE